jgi:glutamyl-tRNA synthetase
MAQQIVSVLKLSSKASPFPFAALAVAAYTGNVDLVFDETPDIVLVESYDSVVTNEHDIVHALAKAGGLSGDTVKVSSVAPEQFRCSTP